MVGKYRPGLLLQRERLYYTAKFECDEDYYNAEAKALELEGKANPQMSFDLEEDNNGTPSVSE